ncbi:MAG TPA: dCTP deaminase [Nitrososphaeria archaeon]|nr:dCTP deaminase [Nitrososphaeria archaeon]
MILSDVEISRLVSSGRLVIRPFDESMLTPNGIDLSVGEEAMIMESASGGRRVDLEREIDFELPPGSHVLVVAEEYLELPPDVVGTVNLRSTYARRGLLIPPTVVDAGYRGRLTLALRGAPYPLRIRRGERIWHLLLLESHPVGRPYSGKYQGSTGLTPAP